MKTTIELPDELLRQVDFAFTAVEGEGLAAGLAPAEAIAVAYEPTK